MTAATATVHASAVVAGETGILIRGPSGAGKSRLAFDLILAGRAGVIPPTQLVGDDRLLLSAERDCLIVRAAPGLAGLIEVHGLGIRRCDFVDQARLGLVVDLSADDAGRMPESAALFAMVNSIILPRIPVAPGVAPLTLIAAALLTRPLSEP
jgi:HPr kinase/phosphorylase